MEKALRTIEIILNNLSLGMISKEKALMEIVKVMTPFQGKLEEKTSR